MGLLGESPRRGPASLSFQLYDKWAFLSNITLMFRIRFELRYLPGAYPRGFE